MVVKYILVTGGVISSIGKGIITSSLGSILKGCGLAVTAIKIDPYLNIDAGTFSPYEHGEVFVLADGGEVDLDLGNYERFLDATLHHDNNITTGKIYRKVIEKERRGDYLGKTVQVVPHITNAIQEWIETVVKKPVSGDEIPEVCVIELGGTIGDIEGMPFIEAFRQFQFRVGRENFLTILVSLIPETTASCEQKTKPTQNSARELRGLGLSPDLIFCRSTHPLVNEAREKISHFCHVTPEQVISVHDCSSLYRVPLLLISQNVLEYISEKFIFPQLRGLNYLINNLTKLDQPLIPNALHLHQQPMLTDPVKIEDSNESVQTISFFYQWTLLADRQESPLPETQVSLVGKYTRLNDSYLSVTKALQHAGLQCNRKVNIVFIDATSLEESTKRVNGVTYFEAWRNLASSRALIVPGGFGNRGTEGMIQAIKWARENNLPFLGICLGLQLAVIEFSRHVLNLPGANSTELQESTPYPVVLEMPEYNPECKGGTMRLGTRKTVFKRVEESMLWKLYGKKEIIEERHRHRFEINPEYVSKLENAGMLFTGTDMESQQRMELMELKNHPYFVGSQFHPEYLTRPLKASPLFIGLVLAALNKLHSYIQKECEISPSNSIDEDCVNKI